MPSFMRHLIVPCAKIYFLEMRNLLLRKRANNFHWGTKLLYGKSVHSEDQELELFQSFVTATYVIELHDSLFPWYRIPKKSVFLLFHVLVYWKHLFFTVSSFYKVNGFLETESFKLTGAVEAGRSTTFLHPISAHQKWKLRSDRCHEKRPFANGENPPSYSEL